MADKDVEDDDVRMEPPWLPPPLLLLDAYQGPLSHLCPKINISILNSPGILRDSAIPTGSSNSSAFTDFSRSLSTGGVLNTCPRSDVSDTLNCTNPLVSPDSINLPICSNSSVAAAMIIISDGSTDPVESGAVTCAESIVSSSPLDNQISSDLVPVSLPTAGAQIPHGDGESSVDPSSPVTDAIQTATKSGMCTTPPPTLVSPSLNPNPLLVCVQTPSCPPSGNEKLTCPASIYRSSPVITDATQTVSTTMCLTSPTTLLSSFLNPNSVPADVETPPSPLSGNGKPILPASNHQPSPVTTDATPTVATSMSTTPPTPLLPSSLNPNSVLVHVETRSSLLSGHGKPILPASNHHPSPVSTDATQTVITSSCTTSPTTLLSSSNTDLGRPQTGANAKFLMSTSVNILKCRDSTSCIVSLPCAASQYSFAESFKDLTADVNPPLSHVHSTDAPISAATEDGVVGPGSRTVTKSFGEQLSSDAESFKDLTADVNPPLSHVHSTDAPISAATEDGVVGPGSRTVTKSFGEQLSSDESFGVSANNIKSQRLHLMPKPLSAPELEMDSSSEFTGIMVQACDVQQGNLVDDFVQGPIVTLIAEESDIKQEEVEDGELEEGQVSGDWESEEESEAGDAGAQSDMNYKDAKKITDGIVGNNNIEIEEEEEGVMDYRTEGLTPTVFSFSVDRNLNQVHPGESIGGQIGKHHNRNTKRRKGKGALARQRKKSRLEKVQKDCRAKAEVNVKDIQPKVGTISRLKKRKEASLDNCEKTVEKRRRAGGKKAEVDTGPEEGELIKEESKGLLSTLVEEEVGLWTTDLGDEGTSPKEDSDEGDGKKKVRGPISAERKLKKKLAFRRKRAEKEKEQGIRRPRVQPSTSKPPVVPCKYYMKGRCTLGETCTFSHDGVPLTKSDPCKFFMIDRCLKGDDCPFSHSLGIFPCKFWHTRGYCLDGDNCRFSHGPLTEEQRQNLAKRIEYDSKDQQTVIEVCTDLVSQEESAFNYNPTLTTAAGEAQDWNATTSGDLFQIPKQTTSSSTSSSLPYSRSNASVTLQPTKHLAALPAETCKEDTQPPAGNSHKEGTAEENSVLLAARRAATAAAEQAAGVNSTDKLNIISRSSPPGITLLPRTAISSLARSSSFKSMTPQPPGGCDRADTSATELLQASLGSDISTKLSKDDALNISNSAHTLLSAIVGQPAGNIAITDGGHSLGKALSGPPLLRSSSRLIRTAVPGNVRQLSSNNRSRTSAMELLQASFGCDLNSGFLKAVGDVSDSNISETHVTSTSSKVEVDKELHEGEGG